MPSTPQPPPPPPPPPPPVVVKKVVPVAQKVTPLAAASAGAGAAPPLPHSDAVADGLCSRTSQTCRCSPCSSVASQASRLRHLLGHLHGFVLWYAPQEAPPLLQALAPPAPRPLLDDSLGLSEVPGRTLSTLSALCMQFLISHSTTHRWGHMALTWGT